MTSTQNQTILDAKVKTPRAVIYARVSGDDRHNATSSIAGQIEQCQAYAGGNGYSVVRVISEDATRITSGANFDLPGVMEFIAMAEKGEFDVLICRDLDRLARDRIKHAIIERDLAGTGVSVEYVNHRFDDSPEGDLSKAIMASLAEFERKKISQRMHRGRKRSARAGKKWGGRRRFGYDWSPDSDVPMVLKPSEAVWAEKMFNWYVYGDDNNEPMSLNGIATLLKDLGVKTARGGDFQKTTVRRLLMNESYYGEWIVNRTRVAYKDGKRVSIERPQSEWITIPVPAIVSKELFDKAQAKIAESRKNRRGFPKRKYLLTGHLRCAMCNTAMSGVRQINKWGVYIYYRCNNCAATKKLDTVEKAVWGYLTDLMTNPTRLENELRAYQDAKSQKAAPITRRLNTVNDLISTTQDKLKRLLDLYLDGGLPKDVYTEKQNDLNNQLNALTREAEGLKAELKNATLSDAMIKDVLAFSAKLGKGLAMGDADKIPYAEKRKLLRTLEVKGVVGGDGIKVSCVIGVVPYTSSNETIPIIISDKIKFI